ncbi:MAG TPA: alpha-amylase family glycosyl hydrolase [Fimbriimonadaceae bacterium]|nr:alpha-amylase family glycosyl hydrolase [Fimbriimonadaceae bacterium]
MMLRILMLLAGPPEDVEHTFFYVAEKEHRSVHLAGSFNGWDRQATPMKLGADRRTWSKTLSLPPGRHTYKFVLDGEQWVVDPKALRNEDDGGGNVNSVLMLYPSDYLAPAAPSDGRLTLSALRHEQEPPFQNWDRGRLKLTLRARPNDLHRVEVISDGKVVSMQIAGEDELYRRYLAYLPWDRKQKLQYHFRLVDGPESWLLGPDGIGKGTVKPFELHPETFQPFIVPDWAQGAAVYQIFPDRYENGDKSNDPPSVQPWDARPTYYNRFGGDVAGVLKRLPHLRQLGVEAVYFNPIFKSPSNHRYETIDYFVVDPEFGTNEEFIRLTRELRKHGMRTVLDGVFNHTATSFGPFKDVVEKGVDSHYNKWYTIHSYPVKVGSPPNYAAWFGFPSMPKVDLMHPEARAFMLDVPKWWHQRAAIGGWRLDVANEVPMDFWRDFRRVVKGLSADNWIVGEHWGDATPWLKGDQWDSVMGYQFRGAALGFIAEGRMSASQFIGSLLGVYHSYPPQASRNLMNLLSSHDTPRFLTLAGGDRRLAMLGAVAQFTWPGTPSIYYGEEVGMEGGADPDNRRGMRWDLATPNNPILQLYTKLVALRKASPSLRLGEPAQVLVDDAKRLVAYSRTEGAETSYTVLNRSDTTQVATIATPAIVRWVDALSGREHAPATSLTISVPPKAAALLLPAREPYLRLARSGFRYSEASAAIPHRNQLAAHPARSSP